MIQRIQTLYLAIVIILLSLVSFGMEIISFASETVTYSLTSYGILSYDESGTLTGSQSYPLYISSFALIALAFLSIMSYRNLARQLRLARMTFYIYFLLVFALFLFSIFGSSHVAEGELQRQLGLGYFFFIAGLPFAFLANLGVKRDKNLIDSLNRLR